MNSGPTNNETNNSAAFGSGAPLFRPGGTGPLRPGGTGPLRPGGTGPLRPGGTGPLRGGGTGPLRPGGTGPLRGTGPLGGTLNLGLIGYPLGHSFSPYLHRAALKAAGLEGDYHLFPVPPLPDGEATLQDLLQQMRAGTLHGLNVTIPHKEAILSRVDELTQAAVEVGAANMIYRHGGRLYADNTDAAGFYLDLKRFLDSVGGRKVRALVLGAGGSARAVLFVLRKEGWPVTIAARRLEQARELAGSADPGQAEAVHLGPVGIGKMDLDEVGLVVNTTPAGMAPRLLENPWPKEIPLPPAAVIYDLIYNPAQTALVRLARDQGLPAVSGAGMLVEQAALSFERWTGRKANRDLMLQALNSL